MFLGSIVFGLIPFIIHIFLWAVISFDITLKVLLLDLLALGLATATASFTSGIKLAAFSDVTGFDALLVWLLVMILPIELTVIALLFALTEANLVRLEFDAFAVSGIIIFASLIEGYLLDVTFAAKKYPV